MPVLLSKDGFKFFFYANEHQPAHIHVEKGDEYAKINITDMTVVRSIMKPAALKKALAITTLHRDYFLEKWHEYFTG